MVFDFAVMNEQKDRVEAWLDERKLVNQAVNRNDLFVLHHVRHMHDVVIEDLTAATEFQLTFAEDIEEANLWMGGVLKQWEENFSHLTEDEPPSNIP